ncbi:MAG: hypothetical protein P8N31_05225 [Planctomycetota bacterium]|nr:hypothetical protein [Planctomycetota bacterium]MDG2142939.1 hypothetical protein [Planctomycetota bacterium]
MKLSTFLFASIATPVLFAFALPADTVSLQVKAGTTLNKSFETTVEMTLDEMRMVMNGEEMDASMYGLEIDMTNVSTLTFIDTYGRLENGRAASLVRTFDTLANNVETSQNNARTGPMDLSVSSASELEGVDVRFTWNAESGNYEAAFADEQSTEDVELLTELNGDADLLGLLPEGDVAVDDTWKADTSVLIALMSPGGDVKLKPEEADDSAPSDPTSELSFGDMLGDIDGEVTCTYLGIREADGVNFAAIKFELDVTTSNDLTELIMDAGGNVEQDGVEISFNSVDVEMSIEGEGTLLWDVRGGHFSSLEFSGDLEQIMDMSMALSTVQGEMDMDQAITMSGSLTLDFSTTKE